MSTTQKGVVGPKKKVDGWWGVGVGKRARLTCAIDDKKKIGSVQQEASTAIRRGIMVTVYLAVRSASHLSRQPRAALPTASFWPGRARYAPPL